MELGQPLAFRFEALRLAQQTAQAVVEFDQPVPLGNCRSLAPNRAQHCFHVSRIGAARHPHLDNPHHDLDAGGTALMGGFVHLC
jgi:hypothetical protein